MSFLKNYIEIIVATTIFLAIILTHSHFYNAIKILLEFIVIIEVVQMFFVFLKRQRIKGTSNNYIHIIEGKVRVRFAKRFLKA